VGKEKEQSGSDHMGSDIIIIMRDDDEDRIGGYGV
jgi:hypothetical protein